MRITGELSLDGADFHGPEIVLRRTRVEGRLRWNIKRTAPTAGNLEVDLRQAQVGFLHDELGAWHGATCRLDGFSFNGIAVNGDNWLSQRKRWLKQQRAGEWSPFPYGQTRAALVNSGYEKEARDIAIEREKLRLREGRLGLFDWLGQWIYRLLLGFGYRPLQLFAISAVLIVAFAGIFHGVKLCAPSETVQQCSGFATPAAHSPTYHSLLFSLDAFTPIDLGQTSAWQPNGAKYAYLVAVETSLGWLFAALLVGAVTGVLRRD